MTLPLRSLYFDLLKARKIEATQVEEQFFSLTKRDDRLALIKDLEPGCYDHSPRFDDPISRD